MKMTGEKIFTSLDVTETEEWRFSVVKVTWHFPGSQGVFAEASIRGWIFWVFLLVPTFSVDQGVHEFPTPFALNKIFALFEFNN